MSPARSETVLERQLAESEARFASIIDSAIDGILTVDLQHRITLFNAAAEKMFQCPATDALNQPVARFIPGLDDQLTRLDTHDPSAVQPPATRMELQGIRRSGEAFPLEASLSPVRTLGQAFYTVILQDVGEKKRFEAQLLRTQRMESLGTLAGGIAHDLNNVLTPMMMAVSLLQIELPQADRRSILSTLQASVERGAEMVKQVLAFARGTDGHRQPMSLQPLIGEVTKLLRQTFSKSIEVETMVAPDLWLISAESTHIHQVLMNLCVNARDAFPQGGRVLITAKNTLLDDTYARMNPEAKPGRYVLLAVQDNGVGIPADVLSKIFDPFFTTKEKGKGTGLGLSTVLGIVKGHGGFVNVYSEVGKGTSFKVYLPATDQAGSPETEGLRSDLPMGQGELILVVDDEASIREIAKGTLEAYGYRVILAKEGTEAVAVYTQLRQRVQVVLTDMMMPVMDGPTTIRTLHSLDPRLPIIAASGFTAERKGDPDLPGVRAFLPKPYTAERLLRTVHEVLTEG